MYLSQFLSGDEALQAARKGLDVLQRQLDDMVRVQYCIVYKQPPYTKKLSSSVTILGPYIGVHCELCPRAHWAACPFTVRESPFLLS